MHCDRKQSSINKQTKITMGYTNYWSFKRNPKDIENADVKLANAVETFKRGMGVIGDKVSHDNGLHYGLKGEYDDYEEPLHLANPCGSGKPILNENGVFAFNGNEDEDGDYESFYVSLHCNRCEFEFGFCKTARKPYDVAVCLALLCLANEFGEDFSYSSDGDIEEGEEGWGVAKRVFNQVK